MQKPIVLQYSYVNRAGKGVVVTMRRIRRMVIMIRYAPKIQIYTLFMKRKQKQIAEDHPCNAALIVGVVCTGNLQIEISQTPISQECYSRTLKTVYEAHTLLPYW